MRLTCGVGRAPGWGGGAGTPGELLVRGLLDWESARKDSYQLWMAALLLGAIVKVSAAPKARGRWRHNAEVCGGLTFATSGAWARHVLWRPQGNGKAKDRLLELRVPIDGPSRRIETPAPPAPGSCG